MKKILLVLAVLLLLGWLIWLLNSSKPVVYQPIVLSGNNEITNTTTWTYLDTVVSVGLDELDVKGTPVLIQPMNERMRSRFESSEGMELEAYIAEWMEGYTICVNKDLGRSRAIEIMAHELLHLAQYQKGRLVVGNTTEVLWLGVPYDVLQMTYNERPWEQEAFAQQADLARRIRLQLLP